MTGLKDAQEFLVEHISQLFHADVLITEQTERIEALEGEALRLRSVGQGEGGVAWLWLTAPAGGGVSSGVTQPAPHGGRPHGPRLSLDPPPCGP